MAYGKGADLEGSSLEFLDDLEELRRSNVSRTNAVLAVASNEMLQDLQARYQKLIQSGGDVGRFTAQQLYARIGNTADLLPAAYKKNVLDIMREDLGKADILGRKAGVNLQNILKGTNDTISKNAKPNKPAIENAGKRLDDFWNKENTAFRDRVRSLTQNAAAQGMSWRKLSAQIRELLLLEQAQGTESRRSQRLRMKMGVTFRADTIARTELATAYVQGQIAHYREQGFEWGRWSAAAERTCGFCMSRDGLVYTMDDLEAAIPAHPRCRCSIIPTDPPEDMRRKGRKIDPKDAANELDDLYWAKSRQDKLKQWKNENRGIRDPKTDSILNNMLKRYAETPTNTQNFLRPGQPAPAPMWAPSGQIIPDVKKAAKAQEDAAAEQADSASKAAKAEAEAKAKEAAAAKAKAAAEEQKRQEEEFERQKQEAERIERENAKKMAEMVKKYKLPQEAIERAMREANKAARLQGADKKATFQLLIKQAQQAQKAAANFDSKMDAKQHYVPTKQKQYVTEKVINDSFELHRKMPGQAGENFRKLEAFMNKHDLQMFFTNPANNPKKFNMKKYNALKEDWEVMRNHPNFQRMIEKNENYWTGNEGLKQQFGGNLQRWQQDSVSDNPYAARAFMTGGTSRAAGFTSGGSSMVAVADWSGHKPIGSRDMDTIRGNYAKNFERRDNNWNLPWSAAGDPPLGAKTGMKGQTAHSWMKTLVHEIGHQVHYRGGLKRLGGDNINPGPFDPSRKNVEGEWQASGYGSTNQLENFAETFLLWVYQPDLLKKYSPEAYKWVDDHMRNALGNTWR